MYAVAALMEAGSEFGGWWDPSVYRIYIVLAASLVGFLGLGTYQLMARKRIGPRNGAWIFISLIPLVGGIILIVFLATEGQRGDNQYGPDPKAEHAAGGLVQGSDWQT